MTEIEQRFESDFRILKEEGQLIDKWSNVYDHCKTEAIVAEKIAELIGLSNEDKTLLVRAAILHDWYKRKESETRNFETSYSYDGLIQLGIDSKICDIAHSVGHSSLNWIEQSTLLRKIMHFIDDITLSSSIVTIDERVNTTESTGRYSDLIEKMRADFNGRNFFDVQREVGNRIRRELEILCNLPDGELVDVIHSHLKNAQKNAS